MKNVQVLEGLERRILHGLSCEWDAVQWAVNAEFRKRMRKPLFALRDFKSRLGYWSSEKREIGLSREFVLNHSWNDIREVLLHEMAHQFASEVSNAHMEPPHGRCFQIACRILKANPIATGTYVPLSRQISQASECESDKIRLRIQKLMALAQSSNLFEAEAAMIKAHELMAKYEIEQIVQNAPRVYFSIFVGNPSLRHFREDYSLALLLMDFFFVKGIWVGAYVVEKEKMGRVLEISGTARNLQIASYVFEFIQLFIESEWKRYNTGGKLNRYRKTDFSSGILSGFRMKLEKESPAGRGVSLSLSPVPIHDIQLKHYVEVRSPRVRNFLRKGGRCHSDVVSDGAEIGKTLVIRKGISQPAFDVPARYLE
jgi:predicted SprT family Zn-dependent metalloprotease